MVDIVTRAGKGSPLTNAEVDSNFTNLKTGVESKQDALVSGTSIKTVNGVSVLGSGNIQIDGGVTSFNTRTGAVSLTSGDVTGALGFTPYNATNPSSFITTAGARSAISVSGSLSYNQTTGVISYTAPTALSSFTNDSGFITSSALSGYLTSATAASTYLTSATAATTYAPLTGAGAGGTWGINVTGSAGSVAWTNVTGRPTAVSSFTNDSGYITSSSLSGYLPLSGGTLSGTLTMGSDGGGANIIQRAMSGWGDVINVYRAGVNVWNLQDSSGSAKVTSSNFYIGSNLALHAGNYTSYSPSLTGSGASGTWSINVTGNANSASTLNSGATINGNAYFRKNQTAGDYGTAALWTESYGNTTTGIAFHISGVVGKFLEMRTNGTLYWNSDVVLHTGNYSSYALPLSGGTISGAVRINNQLQVGQNTNGTAYIDAYNGIARFGRDSTTKGLLLAGDNTATLQSDYGSLVLGPLNASYSHFQTDRPQFYFNKTVFVDGSIYQYGTSYLYLNSGNYTSYAVPLSNGTATNITLGARVNSSSYGGNTSGMSNHSFPAEIRAASAKPTLTWHYENVATRHIALDADGALNVYNPGESGGAVFKVGGNVALHAGNVNSYVPNWSSGVNGSYLVQRDSNGYIYANHVNFSTSETENPTINSFITSNGDGWSRKSTKAHVRNTLIDAGLAHAWVHSDRNFPSGTLIQTDINYAVTYGDPFVLEIRGNAYGSIVPFDIQYQGYIYSDTIINHGGYSNGTGISGLVAINYNGNLCFWFPNQAYWHGYNVRVYAPYATYPRNRVTGISDSGKPTTAKQVDLSSNIRQSLHSGNYTSYSPSLTGSGASGTWGINVTGTASSISGYNNPSTSSSGNTIAYRDGNGDIAVRELILNSNVSEAVPTVLVSMFPTTNQMVRTSPNAFAWALDGYVPRNRGNADGFDFNTYGSYGTNYVSGYIAGSANRPDSYSYPYGTVISFYPYPGQAQFFVSHAGNDLCFRGGWAGSSWQSWNKVLTDRNYSSYAVSQSEVAQSGADKVLRTASNGYLYLANWINVAGAGLFSTTTNGAHFYPNDADYGSWKVVGSRNGWNGLYFDTGSTLMMNSDTVGFHRSGYGWQMRWAAGTGYVHKGNPGGGTEATILDSSNYSSYALPSSGGTVSGVANFVGNGNTGSNNNVGLNVYSTGGNGANMAFHRGGYYAINMGLDSDNVFRIGGWSAGANRLQMDMSGNLTMAGNVTAYSDERLKKDWTVLPSDFVERLAQIKSGTYTRIDSEERQAGVSAQDFQRLLPEVVSEDNDGVLSLAYGNASLASAVELAKRVVEQEARIAKLEKLINQLIGD